MRTCKLFPVALILLSFSLLAATQARANGIDNFVYESGSNTFTWELPANPVITPGDIYPGDAFTISDVSFFENGVAMIGTLDFYNTAAGGGFDLWIGDGLFLSNAFGTQLYNGPDGAPLFSPGTFSFIDYGNSDCPTYGTTLQVTSTPEPATLSLLAIGCALGLALFFLRKN